jgi:hypothetical protein
MGPITFEIQKYIYGSIVCVNTPYTYLVTFRCTVRNWTIVQPPFGGSGAISSRNWSGVLWWTRNEILAVFVLIVLHRNIISFILQFHTVLFYFKYIPTAGHCYAESHSDKHSNRSPHKNMSLHGKRRSCTWTKLRTAPWKCMGQWRYRFAYS